MVDKLLGKHIGLSIQRMLSQEMGELGMSVYKKQCAELNIKPEDVKPGDLVVLSQRMIRALRPTMGDDRANKIGKEILKFKILAELEALSAKPGDPLRERKELDAYAKLGTICYTIGDWDDSLEYYSKVIKIGKAHGDVLKVAEAHRNIGHICKRRSNWDDAIGHFNSGIELSRKIKHPIGIADALAGLGYVYWRRGEYTEAEHQLEMALEVAKESRDKATIGVIHIEFGLVHSDTGNLDKAIEHYRSAIELLEAVKDQQQLSRAFNNLGDVYLQRDDWESAISCFDQCKKAAETINHRMMIAWSLFNSGEAYARLGKPDETIKRCTESLEILLQLNDFIGMSAAYRDLGLAHRLKKDWESAEKNFKLSEEVLKKINSPFNNAHLALEWGEMLLNKGEKKRGTESVEQAVETFKAIGAKKYLAKAERILSAK
jgi:tetratricopeptide (TPR) repeat protein